MGLSVGWDGALTARGPVLSPPQVSPPRARCSHTHLPCQLLEHVLEAILYVILGYLLLRRHRPEREVSGQTQAPPCLPGSANPNGKGSSSFFFSSSSLPTSPPPQPCQPRSSHSDIPNPRTTSCPPAPPPQPQSLSTNRTKAAAPTSSARSAEISSSSSLRVERRKAKR